MLAYSTCRVRRWQYQEPRPIKFHHSKAVIAVPRMSKTWLVVLWQLDCGGCFALLCALSDYTSTVTALSILKTKYSKQRTTANNEFPWRFFNRQSRDTSSATASVQVNQLRTTFSNGQWRGDLNGLVVYMGNTTMCLLSCLQQRNDIHKLIHTLKPKT